MNQYFQRVYTGLPLHTSIHFSLNFWALDSWDTGANDGFYFTFDGRVVDGLHLNLLTFTTASCGNGGYLDLPNVMITGTVAHGASSLMLCGKKIIETVMKIHEKYISREQSS